MLFLSLVKTHALFSHTCNGLCGVVSQQSRLCVFRCAASAAHFFITGVRTMSVDMEYNGKRRSNRPRALDGRPMRRIEEIKRVPQTEIKNKKLQKIMDEYIRNQDEK